MDTHAASHAFTVVTAVNGAVISQDEFPATSAGVSRAVAVAPVAVASLTTCSSWSGAFYGAGVARAFAMAGYRVAEAGAQPRGGLRGKGKTDALDAVRIAGSVLGLDTGSLRVTRADGTRNALRILLIALRIDQVRQVARSRTRTDEAIEVRVARFEATRMARQILDLRTRAEANERQLRDLVLQVAPDLLVMRGVGPVTAAVVIVASSHRARVRSEAAFAALAGTCPIPLSSGNTKRHRLNRGGDRRLNWAIHTIAMVRMGRDPDTKAYIAGRIPEGKTRREAMR